MIAECDAGEGLGHDDAVNSRVCPVYSVPAHGDAPSPLKAQIYSLLVAEQQKSGPLLGLRETEAAGHLLCAWEKLMAAAPIGENGKQMFHCHLCHARLLAEHFENPPIAWAHCPYLDFKKR